MTNEVLPKTEKHQNVTVITLGPEFEYLDEHRLHDLQAIVIETAQSADPPRVLIDLTHTKFFGSAFIEILFRAWNRLKAREGGHFGICGLTPYCAEVIETTHLDRLWPVYKNCDEGIRQLGALS